MEGSLAVDVYLLLGPGSVADHSRAGRDPVQLGTRVKTRVLCSLLPIAFFLFKQKFFIINCKLLNIFILAASS